MHIEDFRDYCIAKKGVTEELPFDYDTLVFKVGGKMFALCSLSEYSKGIALKCNPARAIELRDQYPYQILPGYHMNKTHWNTVLPESGLDQQLIYRLIDESYSLVSSKLTKLVKAQIGLW
ncbi:MmcQ/YjbR family DNA-binding protein [Pontibacter sp. SD6]|uniref:MmcQ/YjbR family DNA-binding protein n=1 Tax=Pontibacter cellulosilyticus TaxID=1720253 RepID=A0A923N4K8_9BACT|nr:MmcQ/YjbR family DNA-binding protein [Pontibacter cellulosilyticus]